MTSNKQSTFEILFLGATGSGKTLLIRRLKQIVKQVSQRDMTDTMPTTGVEVDKLTIGRLEATIREVGGSFTAVWPNFFSDCHAWCYVIDMSDRISLSEAAVEFVNVLMHDKMQTKPVLLILNKKDIEVAMTMKELDAKILINDMTRDLGNRLYIVEASATEGTGMDLILSTLSSFVDSR
uniref:ADP-ribosylation factor-like protein 16 n=1 Tax=Hanusia phi TaxID=3032 RepID=A0A7S0HY62_9CRYP|mmetsp:Transcript_6124/g.14136  ORF Transcript_6124/g.14136 Transcript_6124/m.14136 type:complete len:180 (+) Transcript_6124:170-709(+)